MEGPTHWRPDLVDHALDFDDGRRQKAAGWIAPPWQKISVRSQTRFSAASSRAVKIPTLRMLMPGRSPSMAAGNDSTISSDAV